MTEVPSSLIDAAKDLMKQYLVVLEETKFHNAFSATSNKVNSACVWAGSIYDTRSGPNGFHSRKNCCQVSLYGMAKTSSP
jgi:hypothetical protein